MDFCCSYFLTALAVLFFSSALNAQDTIVFPEVEIQSPKVNLGTTGKKREEVDSTILSQYKFNSLSSLLNEQSVVSIKSYGPGGLATTAMRGGNASQTALIWNGINIQNTMLGQTDLSVLPALAFDEVGVEYGASSSLWGSGAVAGSLLLTNKSKLGAGTNVGVSIGAGSYGLRNGAARINFSKRRFVSTTRFYSQYSQNNYAYRDSTDQSESEKNAQHAWYHFKGVLQEFRYVSGKHAAAVNYWWNENLRQLPVFTGLQSKAGQADNASRLTGSYKFTEKRRQSGINFALLNERLQYEDKLADIYTDSRVNTLIAETDNYYYWNKHVFNFGLNATLSEGKSDNYYEKKEIGKVSLLAGNKFTFLQNRLNVLLNARLEYFTAGALPFTWNLAADYALTEHWSAGINGAKIYRQPTFNELFWQPGGNPNLRAEEGYSAEGNLNYQKKWNSLHFSFNGAAYSRLIDNWILWVPGANGNASPKNLQQVWSRGTETSFKIGHQRNDLLFELTLKTSYVLSTVNASEQISDGSLHRQLIYTPRYTGNANLLVGHKKFRLILLEQYAGYRFTSSDNAQWLNPYFITNVRASCSFGKKSAAELAAVCSNVFNQDYAMIAGRPMPLRNFEISLRLYFNQLNKSIKNLEQ